MSAGRLTTDWKGAFLSRHGMLAGAAAAAIGSSVVDRRCARRGRRLSEHGPGRTRAPWRAAGRRRSPVMAESGLLPRGADRTSTSGGRRPWLGESSGSSGCWVSARLVCRPVACASKRRRVVVVVQRGNPETRPFSRLIGLALVGGGATAAAAAAADCSAFTTTVSPQPTGRSMLGPSSKAAAKQLARQAARQARAPKHYAALSSHRGPSLSYWPPVPSASDPHSCFRSALSNGRSLDSVGRLELPGGDMACCCHAPRRREGTSVSLCGTDDRPVTPSWQLARRPCPSVPHERMRS